jgi:hypothetical protein
LLKLLILVLIFSFHTIGQAQVEDMVLESIDDMSLLDELEESEDELLESIKNDKKSPEPKLAQEEEEENEAEEPEQLNEEEKNEVLVENELDKQLDDDLDDALEDSGEIVDAESNLERGEEADLFDELDSLEDGPGDSSNLAMEDDEDIPDFIDADLKELENESYDDVEEVEIADEALKKNPVFQVSEDEKKRLKVRSDRLKETKRKIIAEQNLLKELDIVRSKHINSIISQKKSKVKNRYSRSQILALEVQLKDILKSPKRKTFIKRGSKLINLITDKYEYNPKGITVYAES